MPISNEAPSFTDQVDATASSLAKMRDLEDKLQRKEALLQRSQDQCDKIMNLISSMLSTDGFSAGTETTRSKIEDSFQRISSLTARQRQIMKLVLAGHPSKNIAADIGICQRTVENHRSVIMQKTASGSISALAWKFIAAAWFDSVSARHKNNAENHAKTSHGRTQSTHSGLGTELF